jgi:hypothetical protein
MTDLGAVLEQLKKERSQLDKAISALSGVVGISSGIASGNGRRGKRILSLSARKRIAAAQRARWAKVRASNGQDQEVVRMPKKRTMSAAARKRIAAAQKARWAKVRAKKAA